MLSLQISFGFMQLPHFSAEEIRKKNGETKPEIAKAGKKSPDNSDTINHRKCCEAKAYRKFCIF